MIILYLKGIAAKEEELAEDCRIDADGIDRYIGRLGIGAAGGGIAALAVVGIVAVILLTGGPLSIDISGLRSNVLRKRANRHM